MENVAVLMAVYNGENYIEEQIFSILNQDKVYVSIYISDDESTDGSWNLVRKISQNHRNVILLPRINRLGSAGQNFFRLIRYVDLAKHKYFAFVDQDDIWIKTKLVSQIKLMQEGKADGVSSDVVAFWPNGKRKYVKKSFSQKKYDYIFESAGPGSTFLMSAWLVATVKDLLNEHHELMKKFVLHDWVVYLICRHSERRWIIASEPSVFYRQHGANVLSANFGFKSKILRVNSLWNGWYKKQVLLNVELCCRIRYNLEIENIKSLIINNNFFSRMSLVKAAFTFRRNYKDALYLSVFILFGFF